MVRSRSRSDARAVPVARTPVAALPPPPRARPPRPAPAWGGALLLAAIVLALLIPFVAADPPDGLTQSNAPWTDEGFNLGNARNRVLFGQFHTDDVDRSLTNGPYSGVAALVFAVTGPSITAGRGISVAATVAAVLLLAAGLARPLGPRAALLAGAALGGCQLLLAYGRLGFTEPLVIAFLTGALVLMARAPERPSVLAGAAAGALLAAAVLTKAIAALPVLVMVAVPLTGALVRRHWRALRMVAAAVAVGLVTAGAWFALVAYPNLDRLMTGLAIWPSVSYPSDPAAVVIRVGEYLADSDGALPRTAALLVAATVGFAALVVRWPALPAPRRELALIGALWGLGTWAAIALGDYAPNRYIVPALPGLAVLAGLGLDSLARVPRPEAVRAVLAAALTVAVAAPGMNAYYRAAVSSGDQLPRNQRLLASVIPDDAVVYGSYGPTMLFGTDARLVTPWAPAGANVDDPLRRFGITHVLSDGRDADVEALVARMLDRAVPLIEVPWGPHTLTLYELRPPPTP